MAYNATVPPTRIYRDDLDRFARACKAEGRTVSEDLRAYMIRKGRRFERRKAKK